MTPTSSAMVQDRIRPLDIAISYDCLPKIGGAHLWLYEVYRRWPSSVHLLTARYSSDLETAKRERAFDSLSHGSLSIVRRVVESPDINLLDLGCWKDFLQQRREIAALSGGQAVRLHCVRAFPEGFAGLLLKLAHPRRTRLFTYAHGEEILVAQSSRQLKMIAKWVYSQSDLVIANSEHTRRLLGRIAPAARVCVIHPGVDVTSFDVDEGDARRYRQEWGWPMSATVFATVARMEPRKNQHAVLRSIARLRNEGFDVRYVCAGGGPEKDTLVSLVRELSLEPFVHFAGIVDEDEKRKIFAACDIHVMPSVQHGEMIEGYGIVFLEAAAAGKPSISGDVGGQPEAVLDGRTGLVVDGTQLSAVSEAMRSLASDEQRRRSMGAEGRRVARTLDWSCVAQRTLQTIEG